MLNYAQASRPVVLIKSLLIKRCNYIQIAVLSQFLVQSYCVDVVSIKLRSFLQGIFYLVFCDSGKSITHDGNQHVEEHYISEECGEHKVNPE